MELKDIIKYIGKVVDNANVNGAYIATEDGYIVVGYTTDTFETMNSRSYKSFDDMEGDVSDAFGSLMDKLLELHPDHELAYVVCAVTKDYKPITKYFDSGQSDNSEILVEFIN